MDASRASSDLSQETHGEELRMGPLRLTLSFFDSATRLKALPEMPRLGLSFKLAILGGG